MNPLPQTKEISLKDVHAKKLYDLSYDAANQCIQCGYCLPACPTYESMGKETHSPRGRINLVKMAAEGKLDLQSDLAEPIDLCLGCRACEVACPVNVPYGKIYESAKEVIVDQQKEQAKSQGGIQNIHLNHLFPLKKRLRLVGNLTWGYQTFGISKFIRKTGLLGKLSKPMEQFEKVLPHMERPSKRYKFGGVYPAIGNVKARVVFFPGCIMDAIMYKTNRLTIELLQAVGCEVIIPEQSTCCGALHAHQGMTDGAKKLAKENIKAFEATEASYIINNAGGCGAMLREYDHLFDNDLEWKNRARSFVKNSRDITEILTEFGPLPFQKEYRGLITYQDSCHLRNVQGVSNQPRELLRSIPGATYLEMENSDRCCASGGIYNLLHFDESMEILDRKMINVNDTTASKVVTTNPGCLLQMKVGIERSNLQNHVEAVHIVELLADACGIK